MSEPKLISPLLDGFVMGPSMSAHPGIRSCPAMPQDSDKRYIVKIISIPASAEQLEAMLLTGAFTSQQSALAYFKDQAQRTIDEIGVLKKLSGLEGFLAFEGWQLVDKEGEPGYELYMLSPYKLSLEQHLSRHTMTHLNAVNLGLDMCASLAVCRRAGYLYVNLKPENIFMSEDKEFRIGDLGFVSMDSLKYTALDERYYSPYSAPECRNLFATINTTADTYAAGMILYQTYNDGKLPDRDADGVVPPPQYADYEMAEIILKAIDLDPAKRWKDPIAMGQALVAYMQKNGANDVPIVPVAIAVAPAPQASALPVLKEEAAPAVAEAPVQEVLAQDVPAVEPVEEELPVAEAVFAEAPDPEPAEEAPDADALAQEAFAAQEIAQQPETEDVDTFSGEDILSRDDFADFIPSVAADDEVDDIFAQIQSLLGDEDATDTVAQIPSDEDLQPVPEEELQIADEVPGESDAAVPAEVPATEDLSQESMQDVAAPELSIDDPANLEFMQLLVDDETAPSEDMASSFGYDELSQEASDILAQADDLLMHETPVGVVAPEPIDVPVPPPIMPLPEEPAEPIATIDSNYQPPFTHQQESSDPQYDYDEFEDDDYEEAPSSFSWKKLLIASLLVLLIGAICIGGYYYYRNIYTLHIDSLDIVGEGNTIAVQVNSKIDDKLITIECIDNNGTKRKSGVKDGYAKFDNLNPDTLYLIYVKVDGNHKVTGEQEERYTTPKITNVISFTAVAGTEDGSATLRFKVDGQIAKRWKVAYSTEGESEKVAEFTDDMVTVTGLTIGKTYTFRLMSDDAVYIVGNDTLQYTATALVMAQDVQITNCDNGVLSVQWNTPDGQSVNSWTVRCYNEDLNYNETLTTAGNTAQFNVPDTTKGYTVAVTAEGMTTPSRAFLKANSVAIRNFVADDSDPTKLVLSWEYGGPTPEGDWLLMYSIDAGEEITVIRSSRTDSVVVPNKVPNATYSFTISTQAGVTVFNDKHTVDTGIADPFNNYKIAAKDIVFKMCKTPEKDNWVYTDVQNYTDTFKVGEKASFAMHLLLANGTSHDPITIMYVIRDTQGNVLSYETTSCIWLNIWDKTYRGELDVPSLPDKAGNYTMEIYFNGFSVHNQQFTMTE